MKLKLILILLIIVTPAKGQTYLLNEHLIDRDKKDFLGCKKEIFDYEASISFQLGSGDLKSSFTDIEDEKHYNPEYLEKLKDSLSKDSLNFKLLFKLGNYYDQMGNKNNGKKYYGEALKHINIKFFDNDTASFYSVRSLTKFKLGKKGFIEDAEKALSLNPNEKISLFFYPMYLFSHGEFEKTKTIALNSINNRPSNPEISILYLILINYIENSRELIEMTNDPSLKHELKQKNYKELIDWSSIQNYGKKLLDKQAAIKLDKLLNFYSLMSKIPLFDKNEKGQLIFNFTKKEKKQIKNLEQWLANSLNHKTLNEYTAYKCIGFINFCLEDNDNAITYYQKAIHVFPKNKPKEALSSDDAYSMLLFLYKYQNKNKEYKNLLLKKISETKVKNISDYINLTKFYLLENQLEKAQFYLEEAEKINPNDFDVYRLKAHLGYVKGTEIIMEGFYLSKASRFIKKEHDAYCLFLQGAIYDMLNSNPKEAYLKLTAIKNKITRGHCKTCDRLLTTYFKIEN